MRGFELADKLLECACLALEREIREFAFGESMRTLAKAGNAKGEDWTKDLQDKILETHVWSGPELWQELATNLQMVQKGVQERLDVPSEVHSQVREEERLVSTATWLADELTRRLEKARVSPPTLEALAQQADVLRNFTEMWTIYQVAWEQRHKEKAWDPDIEAGLTLRSVWAGDRVVRGLYEVVQQELDLIMPHQLLIVVPFMSGLYAAGFDAPTPYIVAPYWGHCQVWTWLGYAHEVGHHVYRNVKGLSDELKVNVAMELWSQGMSYEVQRIWFHWLEEIFADLFGLLQIGAAFAKTQQLMLPHLPFRVLRRMGQSPDLRDALLRAADETHPIPYLRALLAIRTLEKLGLAADAELLEEKWKMSFREDGGVDTSNVFACVRGRYVKLPAGDMEELGKAVLDVILNANLYALAKRKLADVLFEPLDGGQLEAAQQAIRGRSSGGFDMRHLLAATQKSLEELWERTEGKPSDEDLGGLNTGVINAIIEAYQEPALPAI